MSHSSCCETAAPVAAARSSVTELEVAGLNCNNCARKVTNALQAVTGVHSVSVDLETKHASVRWKTAVTADAGVLIAALKAAGYDAQSLVSAKHDHSPHRQKNWHLNLWLGSNVTTSLMLGEWALGVSMETWFQWLAFALGGVVQIFAGAQFYRGAWQQLKVGSSSMDTLVALGSTTAFGYSAWALFSGHGGHVYFMEAAAIITLISVGHWLEARVSARASSALKSLLRLAPQTARRLTLTSSSRGDEALFEDSERRKPNAGIERSLLTSAATSEQEVPVSELKPGDRIALRPGDRVPVDGVVEDGNSALDEAMLTGESAPVDKKPGSELYAGTVNLNGRLVMRVTATGEATALAHIIAAVQRAQTSRANIQRLGDQVSNVFVPVVVLMALAAGLWWGLAPESARQAHAWLAPLLWPAHLPDAGLATAFIIAASVLIIACPCAMGLATPAAIMASANAAAARGILIRDGVALEKAGRISAVVFDKTGTLTEGKPRIVASREFALELPEQLRSLKIDQLAVSIAALSNHPLSKALADSKVAHYQLREFRESPGRGIAGLLPTDSEAPHLMQLGSLRWLTEEGVDCSQSTAFTDEWMDKGATILGLSIDCRLVSLFALRDAPRPQAAKVIDRLENPFWRQGCKVYVVSGDSARTVNAIAAELNIQSRESADSFEPRVFAEVRPEQKAEFVKRLQERGERVAFVGDGINDAPALTQADLGIAVSRASDVAREAADIILLKSEIEAVPEALGLARATLRTIKQNLFWAFFYNALGVPLAALGFMSPVLCAAAMGVSDLVVIGNALRLRRWRARG